MGRFPNFPARAQFCFVVVVVIHNQEAAFTRMMSKRTGGLSIVIKELS
jgi:hypothetical protein